MLTPRHSVLGAEQDRQGLHSHRICELPGKSLFLSYFAPSYGQNHNYHFTPSQRTKIFDLQDTPPIPLHFLSLRSHCHSDILAALHTGTFLPQGFCTCSSLCLECSSSTCLHGLSSHFFSKKDFNEAFPDDYLKSKPSQHTSYYPVPFLAAFLFFAHITFLKIAFIKVCYMKHTPFKIYNSVIFNDLTKWCNCLHKSVKNIFSTAPTRKILPAVYS